MNVTNNNIIMRGLSPPPRAPPISPPLLIITNTLSWQPHIYMQKLIGMIYRKENFTNTPAQTQC